MSSRGVFNELCGQLVAAGSVAAVSREFARLADDRARVEFAYDLLRERGLLARAASTRYAKSDARCVEYTRLAESLNGNKPYAAVQNFTMAVAQAPAGSENLGSAYLGRSRTLYELGIFAGCKKDLQLAAECANADRSLIKAKLAECESARRNQTIGSGDDDDADDDKRIPRISTNANSAITCAGASVAIKESVDCGRYVVATKDIEVSEIIAVEKPYAAIVLSDHDVANAHCHQCLRVSYGLIPCEHCTYALYCSPECKNYAWHRHHQFECAINGVLQELELPKLTFFALRVAILASPHHAAEMADDTQDEGPYESQRYREIHHLCTNTAQRSVADLFNRAVIAALIYEQVRLKTKFFTLPLASGGECVKAAVFKGLLLRHMQTAPSNFHEISERLLRGAGAVDDEIPTVEIGGGAYSFLSMVNHSCAPNVVRYCYGTTIVLMAVERIRQGEQLFDNYGYHYAVMPRDERRKQLKAQYFFDCDCRACVEDWPMYPALEDVDGHPQVSCEEIEALKGADRTGLEKIVGDLTKKAKALQIVPQPCKNIADVQECIKDCYSRLGNTRIMDV